LERRRRRQSLAITAVHALHERREAVFVGVPAICRPMRKNSRTIEVGADLTRIVEGSQKHFGGLAPLFRLF